MSTVPHNISHYITRHFASEDRPLQETRQTLASRGLPEINIQPQEGRFLQLLTAAAQAEKVLEIGTLGGYSGTWIARGLAPGGTLHTLEKNPRHAAVAQDNFQKTGVADRVKIHTGDAHSLLDQIADLAPFDLIFIDADKEGYPAYFNWAVDHIRMGGIITAHNCLRGGRVLDPEPGSGDARMAEFNQLVIQENRVESTIFPVGDGTLFAVRVR